MASPTPTPSPSISLEPALTGGSGGLSANELLNFFSSIIGSLAWPLLVLILVLMFRGPIKKLLSALVTRMGKLKRMKGPGGTELEWFDDTVEELVERSEALQATVEPREAAPERTSSAISTDEDIALRLVPIDPASAIVAAFVPVEQAAATYLRAKGINWRGSPITALRRDDDLPEAVRKYISDMSSVRNRAAHERPDISEDAAHTYLEIAANVADAIRTLASAVDTASPGPRLDE